MSERGVQPTGSVGTGIETLVDALLAEQRDLSAVERFSQRHADRERPLLEPHYRSLIPLSAPRPGEQYAFEVDLDRCSACKACVSACHSLNGLDDNETWREVGFLVGARPEPAKTEGGCGAGCGCSGKEAPVAPASVVVTTACHHCAEPGCLEGCPVLAYDKDPVTGIVRHLDDQCIGCSYCILKCPYEVPKFSEKRGIVRKCDLCHGRLAEGEAPACVQACPNEAIRIALVDRASPPAWTLPDSPDPAITRPTTRYVSRRPLEGTVSAGRGWVRPSAPHWPLAWMLVLTQWGGGLLAAAVLGRWSGNGGEVAVRVVGAAGLALFAAGLVASVFHLGQPMKAWRVWLGWRRSWLSREAMLLGPTAGVAALWLGVVEAGVRGWMVPGVWERVVGGGLWLMLGLSVGAQSMVYVDTRRPFWSAERTFPRFFGTLATALAAGVILAGTPAVGAWVAVAVLAAIGQGVWELRGLGGDGALGRTAWLLERELAPMHRARWMLALGAAVLTGFGAFGGFPWVTAVAAVCWASAAVLERHLFFVGEASDRMPAAPGRGEH